MLEWLPGVAWSNYDDWLNQCAGNLYESMGQMNYKNWVAQQRQLMAGAANYSVDPSGPSSSHDDKHRLDLPGDLHVG